MYKKTIEWIDFILCADQPILNLAAQEFNLQLKSVGHEYGFHPIMYTKYSPDVKQSDSYILHAYGYRKFWNSDIMQHDEWDENNEIWESSKWSNSNFKLRVEIENLKLLNEQLQERVEKLERFKIDIVNALAWWIPIRKWRDKFRDRFL